jgi:uncharacterized phage-like protein YoqJ
MLKYFFLKPFPADFSLKRISFHAWLAFAIVFFILFFIQPFRINELSAIEALKVAFYYACVCPIVIYLLDFSCIKFFPKFYDEKNWNVLKQIAHTILITIGIAVGNLVVSHLLFNAPFTFANVFEFLKYVLIIGVFPITIGVFFSQYQYQKKYVSLSNAINEKIENHEAIYEIAEKKNVAEIIETLNGPEAKRLVGMPDAKTDNPLKLQGQNNNEFLMVKASQIIFIAAADNYVEIHFMEERLKKVLLRSTLSLIHQQLGNFDFFIKCHRSYLVNRNYIVSTSGNAQGLKLKLKDIEETIPVSRTLTKIFL